MNKNRILTVILALIAVGLIGFSAVYGYLQYSQDREITGIYSEIEKLVEEIPEAAPQEEEAYRSPYARVFEMNSDMVAWLKIPGTQVNYPVMHTPGDEEYYLKRDFYGVPNKNGSLFMAAGCNVDKPTKNLLIHGHNMRSGFMFGAMEETYSTMEGNEDKREIILYLPNEERHYQMCAAFYGKILLQEEQGFRYYRYSDLRNEQEYNEYIEGVLEQRLYDMGAEPRIGDQFITLSTCADKGRKLRRFVVVGRRTDQAGAQ